MADILSFLSFLRAHWLTIAVGTITDDYVTSFFLFTNMAGNSPFLTTHLLRIAVMA